VVSGRSGLKAAEKVHPQTVAVMEYQESYLHTAVFGSPILILHKDSWFFALVVQDLSRHRRTLSFRSSESCASLQRPGQNSCGIRNVHLRVHGAGLWRTSTEKRATLPGKVLLRERRTHIDADILCRRIDGH